LFHSVFGTIKTDDEIKYFFFHCKYIYRKSKNPLSECIEKNQLNHYLKKIFDKNYNQEFYSAHNLFLAFGWNYVWK